MIGLVPGHQLLVDPGRALAALQGAAGREQGALLQLDVSQEVVAQAREALLQLHQRGVLLAVDPRHLRRQRRDSRQLAAQPLVVDGDEVVAELADAGLAPVALPTRVGGEPALAP